MAQIIFCYDTLIVTHSLLGTEPYYSPPPPIPADGRVLCNTYGLLYIICITVPDGQELYYRASPPITIGREF